MLGYVGYNSYNGYASSGAASTRPYIWYNMGQVTTIGDTQYLQNAGSGGSNFNAPAYSSNHVYLDGVTQSVPLDIVHELGSDNKKLAASVDVGWTDNLDHTYTGLIVTGNIVGVSTDTTGVQKITITLSSVTAGSVEGYSTNGTYVIEKTLTASANIAGVGFTGICTIVSIEAITLPTASYLTKFSPVSKTWVEMSSTGDRGTALPISTTYSQTESFSHAFSHTSPLTDAEVAQLTDNPDLIWQVWFNSYVLVDGFAKANMVNYWPAVDAESGKYVQNVGVELGVEKCDNGVDFANWDLLSDSLVTTSSAGVKLTADGVNYADAKLGVGGFDGNSYYIVDIAVSENTIDAGTILLFRETNMTTSGLYITSGETGRFTAIFKTIPSPLYSYTWAFVDPNATAGTYILISEYSIRKATAAEIANYTSNCRSNYLNTSYGPTNLAVIQDGSGRPTAISPTGTTQWSADGRTAVTGWTITAPFTVYEELDGVKYVWTSDSNKYVAGVASGTYTLPTGVWTLADNLAFDNTTTVAARGNVKLFERVLTPTEITAL